MSLRLWGKMGAMFVVVCVGGPALVYYVSPTEEELFKKYNPDLQKRSLENRQRNQENFNEFVSQLKEHSKSNKPIWQAAAEHESKRKEAERVEREKKAFEAERQRQEIRGQSTNVS